MAIFNVGYDAGGVVFIDTREDDYLHVKMRMTAGAAVELAEQLLETTKLVLDAND